jgi:hypothetical protein
VFLDMPLESIHKNAFKAAQAAHCSGEQGKYWEMHDRLFESQKALEPWVPHAEAVGLDVAKFEACLASGKFDQEIRRDMGEARKVGVTGTPAFMVGRTEPGSSKVKVLAVLKGARSFADFKAEIDRLYEEAAKPRAEVTKPQAEAAPSGERTPVGSATTPPAPRVSAFADGKLDETTKATLARVLGTAPAGSPAWIAAPQSDTRAVALAQGLAGAFTTSGWRTRPVRRTAVRVKPGTYLFVAEEQAPAYVEVVRQALEEAGFAPTVATGYRQYYQERRAQDSSFQGFPFAPEQTFLVVLGRMP